MTADEAYAEMKKRYDGFRFSGRGKDMYNPWSVMKTLGQKMFGYYWYGSGTPSYLIKLIRDRQLDLTRLNGQQVADEETMMSYEDAATNIIAPLYQGGYLTIKSFNLRQGTYLLGFPNMEVERAFSRQLLPDYTRIAQDNVATLASAINVAAQAGDVDALLTTPRHLSRAATSASSS